MFLIVNYVISILRKNLVSEEFNVLFEEKKNRHLHIWILPRKGWKELEIDPTKDIGKLQQYAKENMKTKENASKILKISETIKNELQKIVNI